MPKTDPDAVKRQFVEVAFDEAYRIREELYGAEPTEDNPSGVAGLFPRRKANRDQLRSLAAQGFLDDEQRTELEELYPVRKTKAEVEEEADETATPAAA